jgi:transcriptional regulator with XRE-family HTH domain
MQLIAVLVAEQKKLGLSDRAFARRLGVSQALWSNTKSGKWPVGRKLLAAVTREFPQLRTAVLTHLQTVA